MSAKCDKCGTVFNSNKVTDNCPACGELIRVGKIQRNVEPNKVSLWQLIAGGCVFVVLVWITLGYPTKEIQEVNKQKPKSNADLQFIEGPLPVMETRTSAKISSITGVIKNNGPELAYIQVQFSLFDGGDRRVGTAIDNLNSLKPNEEWRFTAHCLEDARRFELTDITGF